MIRCPWLWAGVGTPRFGDSFVVQLSEADIQDLSVLTHYTINEKNRKVVKRLRRGIDYDSLPPNDIPKLKNVFNLTTCVVVGSSSSLVG